MHLLAYKELAQLNEAGEETKENKENGNGNSNGGWVPTWQESNSRIYLPPIHLLWPKDGPVGYAGPGAPIGDNGRVKDTKEVELAKAEHKKAFEHAAAIAKRHPPRAEDNSL